MIAEDESTCTVWGMPKAVAERGIADAIVPLHEVARTIARMITTGSARARLRA